MMDKLARTHLLRGLDDHELALVQEAGERMEVPSGQRIIEEGAVPRRMVLVVSGKLEVFIPEPADRSTGRRLASLNPGDSCGEYGFIDRRPASASVKAVADSEIFVIYNSEFDELMRSRHGLERKIYRNLLQALVDRLRASNVVIDMLRPNND